MRAMNSFLGGFLAMPDKEKFGDIASGGKEGTDAH